MDNARKIRLTETTVERTARLLSQQFGINVVWRPGECKTDGNTIYLPTLPPDAPDELLEAIHGFLDHETGHVLFTDFKALRARNPVPTQTQFHCINVIEDIRIESAICGIFPGSAANLRASNDWLMPLIAKNWNSVKQFMRACATYGNYISYGDETDFWNAVDPKTRQLVADCVQAVGPHSKITSTDLAIDAGLRMYEVIKEFAEEEEEENKKREEQKRKNAATMASGGTPVKVTLVSKEQLGEMLGQTAAAMVVEHGRGKRSAGASGYQHGLTGDNTYIVYSTAGDTVASIPDNNLSMNGRRLNTLRDEARELTGVIRIRLVNSLRAQSRRRWVGGKEEGKIDARRLHHAIMGTSNDVYKQLSDKIHLDTAVCMAIDHSGSMDGRKLELAGEAAIVMGDALNTLRVPFAVYGYSTESPKQSPPDSSPYARWSHLWIRYYRDFGESWEKGAVRLAGSQRNVRNNTLDAESVKHGVRRLLARKEKRKILFVLNDGMPYPGYGHLGRCQQHLHAVVASAAAAGVEVVAFGIQDSAVKQYYPNSVVIQKLDDLAKEPLKVLDGMLRKGVRAK